MSRPKNYDHVVTFMLCALLGGVAAVAQAPQKSDTGVVATISVTGCLARWTPDPAAGGEAAAAKPPAGVQYMLTHAEGQAASATSSTTTPQPVTRHERYLLLEAKGVDYAAHVNHRVRIVGTIAPQPSTGASPAQQAADPSSRETNLPDRPEAASYDGNLVDVSTLTMVSRSCAR